MLEKEIKRRLDLPLTSNKSLIITPLLSNKQISDSAIDLRLGNEFILFKKRSFPVLNVFNEKLRMESLKYFEIVKIDYDSEIVLHPNQLVLGSTFEYIKLPCDVISYVIGKSTWGRMGLITATAIKVDPGFRGVITLELVNIGEVPLILKPKMKIVQITFHKTDNEVNQYSGKYMFPTGPGIPNFDNIGLSDELE